MEKEKLNFQKILIDALWENEKMRELLKSDNFKMPPKEELEKIFEKASNDLERYLTK